MKKDVISLLKLDALNLFPLAARATAVAVANYGCTSGLSCLKVP